VELHNAFDDTRKGHPSESTTIGRMMRELSDRMEEFKG
jgi:hypothetical protein